MDEKVRYCWNDARNADRTTRQRPCVVNRSLESRSVLIRRKLALARITPPIRTRVSERRAKQIPIYYPATETFPPSRRRNSSPGKLECVRLTTEPFRDINSLFPRSLRADSPIESSIRRDGLFTLVKRGNAFYEAA